MNLDAILHLNKSFKQFVQDPTWLDPPRILDPIITTLSNFYQVPKCLPPLNTDPTSLGKPSDHLMVVMEPISEINNQPGRSKREIKYRPFNDERLHLMQEWIDKQDWNEVTLEKSAHTQNCDSSGIIDR
jgi:hypothetical protein